MTKRSKGNVLFVNALGGPRLIAPDETADLSAPTADGKRPNFRMLTNKQAARFLAPPPAAAVSGSASILDILSVDPPDAPDMKRIQQTLIRAKHFALDVDAYRHVAALAEDKALIDELAEFALPPFDVFSFSHINDGSLTYPRAAFDGEGQGHQSLTIWDHGKFKLMVARADGSSLAIIPGWVEVSPSGAVTMDPAALDAGENRDNIDKVIGSMRLHFRLLQVFFLILASPKAHTITFREGRRTIRKGRPVRYFARSEIKIDLTAPAEIRRAFVTGDRGSPRWHEVRRHFVHFGGSPSCIHAWSALPVADDGKKRWVCDRCERRRCERFYPNGRGDAGKGFVRQSYAITAGERE